MNWTLCFILILSHTFTPAQNNQSVAAKLQRSDESPESCCKFVTEVFFHFRFVLYSLGFNPLFNSVLVNNFWRHAEQLVLKLTECLSLIWWILQMKRKDTSAKRQFFFFFAVREPERVGLWDYLGQLSLRVAAASLQTPSGFVCVCVSACTCGLGEGRVGLPQSAAAFMPSLRSHACSHMRTSFTCGHGFLEKVLKKKHIHRPLDTTSAQKIIRFPFFFPCSTAAGDSCHFTILKEKNE